jgi:hypothetical protein
MFLVDLRHFGQFLVMRPRATLRAFGTTPYARLERVPLLSTRGLQLRIGSFYVWAVANSRRPLVPLLVYFEVSTVPAFSVRAAWLRGIDRGLLQKLFAEHPQH